MRRHIFAACGALAIASVTMAAQTPSPSQPPPSPQPSAAAGAITVQGCLKPASGSASTGTAGAPTTGAPTTGATGTSGAGAQFILTDAETKSGAGSPTGATGTTGTPSPSRSAAMDDESSLRAESASVNLAQHVNHQVELTGRVSPAAGGASTPPAAGTAGATRPASSDRPTFTVTSLKMIAAECK